MDDVPPRAPAPRVLVAVASRHGATAELAEVVAAGLRAGLGPGAFVNVRAAGTVDDVAGYDAVVIGSAVYFGHWLPEARDLLLRCALALWERPVWLFSSGPLGVPPLPPDELLDVDEVVVQSRCRGHRIFPGRLDRSLLGFPERAVVTALHAPEGDFRDPGTARAWGAAVAAALAAEAAPA